MRGSFAAIHQNAKEARKRQKEYEKNGGGKYKSLYLKDGDVVFLYFTGKSFPKDIKNVEPLEYRSHFNKAAKFSTVCAGPSDCAVCQASKAGTIAKNLAGRKFAFNIWEARPTHILENGRKKEYVRCTQDRSCRMCHTSEGKESKLREGRRHTLELAERHVLALGNADETLSETCASCLHGKVKLIEYVCSNKQCGELLSEYVPDPEFPEAKVTCGECGHKIVPAEELECSTPTCKSAIRATVMESGCPVRVKRTGGDTNTVYDFLPIWPPPPMPPHMTAADAPAPFDLVKEYTPPTDQEEVAEAWGITSSSKVSPSEVPHRPYDDDTVPF